MLLKIPIPSCILPECPANECQLLHFLPGTERLDVQAQDALLPPQEKCSLLRI